MTMFGSQWLANAGSTYEIDQSIRFNNDDTPILSRTLGTPTDRNKFTYSFWVKPSSEANGYALETNVTGGVTFSGMVMDGGNMAFYDYTSGSANIDVRTTFTSPVGKFRDYSAWYHAMFVYDSDQGTDSNRLKFYINGVQFPSGNIVGPSGGSPVWPSSGYNSQFNNNVVHRISSSVNGLIDGYMAEINFIDGQALTPADFGKYNADGVWIPIEASPTYGTNGFYITGETASDLGEDFSGNNNDFTSSGLATTDQMLDTPTNNMPTLNLLSSGTGTLSDGNLQYVGVSSWTNSRLNLLVPDTGKWALRFKSTTSYQQFMVGLCAPDSATTFGDLDVNGVAMIRYNTFDGNFVTRVTGSRVADTGPPAVAAQTFFQLLFDMDNGKIGVATDGATSGTFADISTYPALDLNAAALQTARQPYVLVYSGIDSGAGAIVDAGQSGWETTVTGFKNLILANLDTPTISDGSAYFQATTYTGDGSSSHEINQTGNSSFEPSLVWIKSRSAATNNVLQDQVRGDFVLFSELTNAQGATGGGWVNSFDSNGFNVNVNAPVNDSGKTFVGWQWKAAGSGSSNTDGDITSTVSANTTAGFSIITYSGNGSDNQTIGHGLGIAPKMIISKRTDTTGGWTTYHDAVGINQVFYLNSTSAPTSNTEQYRATPTSSVYTVGVGGDINNSSGTYVAYCFAEIPGYSKIGSYEGNSNADGSFVYTGFKPAFILNKNIDTTDQWGIRDTTRNPFNVTDKLLNPNASTAETSAASGYIDILSNGFKARSSDSNINTQTIIYMAFAEHPFGGDGVAPATGR